MSILSHGWDWRFAIPVGLVLMTYPLALLVWHSDSAAVDRHTLHVAMQWRLVIWLFILISLEVSTSKNQSNAVN